MAKKLYINQTIYGSDGYRMYLVPVNRENMIAYSSVKDCVGKIKKDLMKSINGAWCISENVVAIPNYDNVGTDVTSTYGVLVGIKDQEDEMMFKLRNACTRTATWDSKCQFFVMSDVELGKNRHLTNNNALDNM